MTEQPGGPEDAPDGPVGPAGPADRLARIDQRLVPSLQRGARRIAHALAAPLRVVARVEERVFPQVVRRVAPAWRVPALVAAVIVVLASAVHLQRFPELREGERLAEGGVETPAPRSTGDEVDPMDLSARSVGPRQGGDLEAYVPERESALAAIALDQEVAAVVSFAEYVAAAGAADLVPADVRVLRAQYRIPAEGERPREVAVDPEDPVGDIEAAIAEALGRIDDEITEVQALLDSGTVEDPSFAADLERRLSELQGVRNILQAAPEIVFAIVVEGTAGDLRALAEHDAVRLVDPAPVGSPTGDLAFYGLLPEDRTAASFGAAR